MGSITLGQAAAWCGGYVDPKYTETAFFGANNDSRKILPGQLFIALQGERDGHDFIPKAMENGAAAVLCSRSVGDYPAIIVEDTRLALGKIAAGYRQKLGVKVVGVTGSVGKSTTKEMISCVLASCYRVAKTPMNHNNDIGMPMAILSIEEDTQIAVLEMGMNHFREIAYLTNIARPDAAVIINIGTMHIEHLGSQSGILRAKMEITEGMDQNSMLFLNGDDPYLWNAQDIPVPVTYFGSGNEKCAVRGVDVCNCGGRLTFQVRSAQHCFPVSLELEGEHYLLDAMAAISVGLSMGIAPEKICSALATFQNMEGRQEIFRHGSYTIIKDCYNAGPESMAAALSVLGNREGRRIAVLGDMLELGGRAPAEHYRIGRIAAEKADMVFAYGPNAPRIIAGARTGGMGEKQTYSFESRDMLAQALKEAAKDGDVLLFKGSHGMHMELALEAFLKD